MLWCGAFLWRSLFQLGRANGYAHAELRFLIFLGMIWQTHAETIKNRQTGSVAPQHLSWDRTASGKGAQRFGIRGGP